MISSARPGWPAVATSGATATTGRTVARAAVAASEATAGSAGTEPTQPRALVVDDNDMIRTLVSRLLRHEGHTVDVAASVEDALALPTADYQTLIIDVRLGSGSGTDLIERLRAQDPSTPTRCLLLTGGIDDDLPLDVAVLRKPFSADQLITAVHGLRRGRRPAAHLATGPAEPPGQSGTAATGVATTTMIPSPPASPVPATRPMDSPRGSSS
ncbi:MULTISPECIES: response regulator [unclassified Pseudofrankia]|uniref:response regulator n=1 Tax=unclassified Pseudofrankia TaxID=2994372 RepID=UPI000AAD92E9|nr:MULTISPECIES: response regulator [unclassified Pseudofrankia]MDT3439602.1 response regulator [Pseudofrankia sp. BMG5.37]